MGSLYSDIPTWLHRIAAGHKLLALAVLGVLLFAQKSPLVLGLAALLCAWLWWSLGAATAAARRLLASVLIAALLVAVFHLAMGHLTLAAVSTLRLVCASLLGVAFSITTRPGDVVDVLERVFSPLARIGIPVDRLALQIALMMRFIEHFFTQWQKLADAHRLRTGRHGGLRLIPPLAIHMLLATRRVADALWARLGH